VRYAAEGRADLVILATHGHGALKRALVGATAGTVVRNAPCPVLLVPPKLWRGEAEDADDGERDAAEAGELLAVA
jgi:Universal stress protein family